MLSQFKNFFYVTFLLTTPKVTFFVVVDKNRPREIINYRRLLEEPDSSL